jgi:hypothetical protein
MLHVDKVPPQPRNSLPLYLSKVVPPFAFLVPSPTAISRSAAGRTKQPSPVVRSDPCFLPTKLELVVGTPGPSGSARVLGSIAPFASKVRICRHVAQSSLVRLQFESKPVKRYPPKTAWCNKAEDNTLKLLIVTKYYHHTIINESVL